MSSDKPILKFDDARSAFLNSIPASKKRTNQTYTAAMNIFGRFLENSGNGLNLETPLFNYPEDVLLKFFLWLDKQGYSVFTQNTYLAGLHSFLWFHDLARNLNSEFNLARAAKMLGKRKLNYPQVRVPDNLPQLVLFYDQQPLPPSDDRKATRRRRLCLLRDRAVMHTLYDSAGRVSALRAPARVGSSTRRSDRTMCMVGPSSVPRAWRASSTSRPAVT